MSESLCTASGHIENSVLRGLFNHGTELGFYSELMGNLEWLTSNKFVTRATFEKMTLTVAQRLYSGGKENNKTETK